MKKSCFLISSLFLKTGYTAKKNWSIILECVTWWWKNTSRHTSIFKIIIISSFLSKKPSPLTTLYRMRINLKCLLSRLLKIKTRRFLLLILWRKNLNINLKILGLAFNRCSIWREDPNLILNLIQKNNSRKKNHLWLKYRKKMNKLSTS